MKRTINRRAAMPGTLLAAALLVTACTTTGPVTSTSTGQPSDTALGGTVTVMGAWSGAEQDSFLAMVKPWEEKTGVTVNYTGTRDLNAQLTAGIASGNLPDVAGLPGPGPMQDLYEQAALKPLDFVDIQGYSSTTPAGFAELGKAADGKLIGIFVRAAVKGLIWYDPKTWKDTAPASLKALTDEAAGAAPKRGAAWCVGLESGAASGWPATDWLEDIILRQAGPDVYDKWVAGEQPWASAEIKAAWQAFGEVLDNAHGGSGYVVSTNFGKAANPMFTDPQGCLLHHQASFITDFFANEAGAKPGDYDFFPFPDIDPKYAGSVTGSGDLFGMFNDTPQARSLITYLLTPQAQQIWVERGGSISGNRDVPLDAYPDDTSRRSAEILRNAQVFRFDGSDQMPAAMNEAFFAATLKFAKDPSALDSILAELDRVRSDAYEG